MLFTQHSYHGKTIDSHDELLTRYSRRGGLLGDKTHLKVFDKIRAAFVLSIKVEDQLLDYNLDQDNIYYLTKNSLIAVEKKSSIILWKKSIPEATRLTIIDDIVYCHTDRGILGINSFDGSEICFYHGSKYSEIMAVEDILIVTFRDFSDKSHKLLGSSMQAIVNDQRIWINRYDPHLGRIYVIHNALFRTIGRHIIRIDPSSGNELWSICKESSETYRPVLGAVIDKEASVIAMPEIVSESNYGNLAAISINTGSVLWRYTCGYRYYYPVIDENDILYAGYVDTKTIFDPSFNWNHESNYSGTGTLNIVAIDVNTGKLIWRHTATTKPASSVYNNSNSDYEKPLILSNDSIFFAYGLRNGQNVIERIDKNSGRTIEKRSVKSCAGDCGFISKSHEGILFCNGKHNFSSFFEQK